MKLGSTHNGAAYFAASSSTECKEFLIEAGLIEAEARWECPCGKMWGGLDWNKHTGWYAFFAEK